MKLALAADHGGFDLKQQLKPVIEAMGYEVLDLGAHRNDPHDDYPDYARYAAQAIQSGQAKRAIVICGSGVGACVAANKIKGVRACVCHDTYSAGQGVEHDDMNVLCLGARIIGIALATQIIQAFLKAKFDTDERFVRRLDKVLAMEASQ